MDFFENRYYKNARLFMIMIGQWPYYNHKTRFIVRFFVIILLISSAWIQIAKFLTSKCTLDLIVEVIPPLTICVLWATKYITCWINMEIIKDLLQRIKDDWDSLEIIEELKITQNFVEQGRLYGIFLTVLLYSSICVIISIPFLPCVLDIIIPLNDSRPLQQPFQVEYFIDHEKYFFPILAHLFVVIFVGLTIGLATDLLFITFLLHGCAMFAVLEYRLENMFNSSMEKFSNVNNMFYLRVASCVTHHKRVVKFVARINSYYTTSGAIQLILAVLILTILLLRLFERLTSIHNVDMADLAICIVHITGHLIVIFLNMFPTQKLLNCSETIFFKAYCSSWYWTPVRMQKLLLLIMQRSIKPCGITAAGRWKASLEMFSKIVETSMSYFMVLYTIRQ